MEKRFAELEEQSAREESERAARVEKERAEIAKSGQAAAKWPSIVVPGVVVAVIIAAIWFQQCR